MQTIDSMTATTTADPNDFDTKTQTILLNLLLQLADNKYMLGRRYAEWVNSAPLLEAAVAAAAMTQDELGHARSIYPLFRKFPDAPPVLKKEEDRETMMNITFLDRSFADWPEFVAANYLFDQALSVVFEAARESTFEPLKQRTAKILQEERFHAMYGATWVRSLSKEGTAARQVLNTALHKIWPEVICWLGRPGDPYQKSAIEAGLLCDDVEALQQTFLKRVGPLLQALNHGLPISYDENDGHWTITNPLPWEQWDAKTRRLS
ncbi:MAG: Phenylacetic acid catabolic protein [Chloroflexota bacterium]